MFSCPENGGKINHLLKDDINILQGGQHQREKNVTNKEGTRNQSDGLPGRRIDSVAPSLGMETSK